METFYTRSDGEFDSQMLVSFDVASMKLLLLQTAACVLHEVPLFPMDELKDPQEGVAGLRKGS